MAPLAGDGDLGVRASIADVEALGSSVSIEDAFKVCAEASIPDSCRIGIETPFVGVGGLGTGASLGDIWNIGATMSLAGSLSWTETPAAWHAISPTELLRSSPTRTFPIMQK